MLISKLIKELQDELKVSGDVEVTCTGSTLRDGYEREGGGCGPEVFETTVENVIRRDNKLFGKHVRIYL